MLQLNLFKYQLYSVSAKNTFVIYEYFMEASSDQISEIDSKNAPNMVIDVILAFESFISR